MKKPLEQNPELNLCKHVWKEGTCDWCGIKATRTIVLAEIERALSPKPIVFLDEIDAPSPDDDRFDPADYIMPRDKDSEFTVPEFAKNHPQAPLLRMLEHQATLLKAMDDRMTFLEHQHDRMVGELNLKPKGWKPSAYEYESPKE
jgi:hypothetical protein